MHDRRKRKPRGGGNRSGASQPPQKGHQTRPNEKEYNP